MIKNSFIFAVVLMMAMHVNAQDLSGYKYVIVPAQFGFQNEPGQYKVNNLTKFLFQKYGFNAYLSSEVLPPDLNANGCNTLYMAADAGGFLGTHLTYTLANCRGQIVYTSPEGKSKIKEYTGAYNEVMREAMEGLADLGYTYSDDVIPIKNTVAVMGNDQGRNMPQNSAEQTAQPTGKVVVAAIPNQKVTQTGNKMADKGQMEEKINKNEEQVSGGNEAEEVVASNETNKVLGTSAKAFNTYKSTDGSYMLKSTGSGFDVYESDTKIGEARETSSGSYLVNTSEFTGVGSVSGDTFIVEREIKGVQGLVKMEFKGFD